MPGEKIRSLQILRFVAAAMVVAAHAIYFVGLPQLQPAHNVEIGAAGVDIFFVLSGFVIYRSAFALRRMTAGEFIAKRFLRVAPLYYLTNLVWLLLLWRLFHWPVDRSEIAASFTFWPAWQYLAAPVDPVGWSLCFEMLFYVAVALVLFSRRALPLLLAAFLIAWLGRAAVGWPGLRILGNPIALEFLLGVLIAASWNPTRVRPSWIGYTLFLLGAVGIYAFCLPAGTENARYVLDGTMSLERVWAWGIPAALLVGGALAIEPHLKGAWLKIGIYLGDASYAIYLVHWPLLAVLNWQLHQRHVAQSNTIVCVLFLLGLSAGIAVHQFVERPVNGALSRFTSRFRVPAAI
jgi:exopolysaccharide production protein ExoZ